MDTMRHAGVTDQTGADTAGDGPTGKETRAPLLDRYLAGDFPWYGLDEGWTGRRWLGSVCEGREGLEYGTLGHGDTPSRRPGDPTPRKFVAVVTVPRRERRRSGDGAGMLEATSVASAASVAGVGLLSDTWQWELDREMRQEWVEQQTYLAWELADDLDGDGWTGLALPVDGVPNRFRYRESAYGWVMAGEAAGVYLGVYGHGVSAYGLGLSAVRPAAYA